MNGFTGKEIIGGLLSLLMLSYAAIFGFIFKSIREFRRELHDETSALHDETSALRRDMQLEFSRVHEQLTALA